MNKEDLKRLAIGATFLGAGGGGTLRASERVIEKQYQADPPVELISVEEVPDDGKLTVACGFLAAQSTVEDETNLEDLIVVLEAYKQFAGTDIARLVPIDLGVQSSVVPVCVAAQMLNRKGWDLKVVDADGAGRAVPLLASTTLATASTLFPDLLSPFPALFGGTLQILSHVPGKRLLMRFDGEDPTAFYLREAAFGALKAFGDQAAALVCWPMKRKEQLQVALPPGVRGTLSLARDVGSILADQRANCVEAAMKFLDEHGWQTLHLFQGAVENVSDDQGRVDLTNPQNSMVVLSAGENLAAIDVGQMKVKAMAPDSICYVSAEGVPFSSAEVNELFEPGKPSSVHVIGIQARNEVRKSELIQVAFKSYREGSVAREKNSRREVEPLPRIPPTGPVIDVNLTEFQAIEDLNPKPTST